MESKLHDYIEQRCRYGTLAQHRGRFSRHRTGVSGGQPAGFEGSRIRLVGPRRGDHVNHFHRQVHVGQVYVALGIGRRVLRAIHQQGRRRVLTDCRNPHSAGNTSLAAAFCLARELPQDALLVVQETEYTGAGKHQNAQLAFAREHGITLRVGDPAEQVPGQSIVLPEHPGQLRAAEVDLNRLRRSLIHRALTDSKDMPGEADLAFLAAETRTSPAFVRQVITQLLEDDNETK